MQVSTRAFYAWAKAPESSAQKTQQKQLETKALELVEKNKKTYGSRRLSEAFKKEGIQVGRFKGNGSVAPHGLPDLILASSQFLVRIDNENKYTMAAACGSLAREWLESDGLLSPARAQSQNLFTLDAA